MKVLAWGRAKCVVGAGRTRLGTADVDFGSRQAGRRIGQRWGGRYSEQVAQHERGYYCTAAAASGPDWAIDAWHSGGVGCDAVGRPRAIGSGRLFVVSGRRQRSVMGRSRCQYRVGGKRQWWWLSAAVTQSKVKRRALSTHREGSSAGARALTSLPSAG